MNRTTATILGLREQVASLQEELAGLIREKAVLEVTAFRLLRRASPMLSNAELAEYEAAFNVRPEANKPTERTK